MNIVVSNASTLWGGLHTVTEALVRGLAQRGHRVVLLCRANSVLERRMRDVVPCTAMLGGTEWNPVTIARIARLLRRHRADVVLSLKNKDVAQTVPAAALMGVPAVVRRADDQPFRNRPDVALLFGRLTAHHVANSRATRATMLRSAPWLPPETVSVIHNGVDPEPFRTAAPAALPVPAGAVVVGFVGRIEERKGIFDLAAAWPRIAAAVPTAHLVLVGTGPQEAEARQRFGDAARVHWLGFRTDAPALIKALDLAVVPSHWEGFNFVLAEAMAAGVAVAASRTSNLPELFDEGVQGRFFAPHNPLDLARVVAAMAGDPAARSRMGAAGVDRVHRCFTTERMTDEYEALLLRVTCGERGFGG